ncbi:MDIS1-interacting receptor like kinase 1 [Zea mays]|uniref:Putative leucine-rich repeat receptor-like protein kinase family protein n=1 Tax=Zea mays TaxID=4577 RepID=K7VHI1_MAIZE|nr:MDIS1-interacting receptor like kinase 1 [Zea mays]AQL09540.1 Putative leucine-rich repeat receptor-like protein kinase family protein [Zea mays]|eukprot:XP_008660516.1 MDIS1-interacting receptor like kinase 1 [Zea mays]
MASATPMLGSTARLLFPLSFSLALLLLCCSAVCNAAGNDDESTALLAIKASLVDPLGKLAGWNPASASSHCTWDGVRCNARGAVAGLNLAGMNLSGTIPDAILGLTGLTSVVLQSNAFGHELPLALVSVPTLRELDVSDNSFDGHFPAGLGALASLAHLNASGNNFAGPLPPDIGNATALETLDFRGGYFSGTIPKSYGKLRKLRFLGLSGNNLGGALPAELFEMSALEQLIIGYNEFVGAIPAAIGNLANLQYLDLAIAKLEGPIPPELGGLSYLNTVFLYKNNIGGPIPKEIGNLTSLVMLDLSDNALTGTIPLELGQLANLQLLNLMCNRLKGGIPAAIGDLPKLEVLELWNNSLTGALPPSLGGAQPLQWLDVSTNALSGPVPAGLCDSGNLTKLILFNNVFTGPIPAGLTTCATLVRVRAHNNRLNGTVPAGLGRLPRLQRLELAGNELSGEIPDDLALSTSLSFIDLSHNQLRSALPSSILSIRTLQTFAAADNELTGGVPDEIGDCPSLSALDLSRNRLSGAIPASLASCQRLVSLNLRSNRFTGQIPGAIAMMSTLSVLDLSSNSFTGVIPSNFGGSPALEMLNLAYNNLTGPVPTTGLLRTINPDDLAGNPGLCGGVLPPCGASALRASSSESYGLRRSHVKHIAAGWAIGISVSIVACVVVFLGKQVYQRWYVNGRCCDEAVGEDGSGAWPWRLTAFQRLSFTSAEVLACIKEDNIVGMGGTGVVYRADMPRHHAVVAVKKLWRAAGCPDPEEAATADGRQDVEPGGEFAAEVKLLGRLRHRNVVRMLGYVSNNLDTMVLYEYMVNGSLWEALHGRGKGKMLVDWVSRYNVAVGVAAGLAYLHHDCRPPVIHRDIKSSNVLLDINMDAKIADFGLARVMARAEEPVPVSMVAGSYGYIAPECGCRLKVDQKSDIYSFGVVLMELLTGRRPVEPEYGESQDIVGWIRERLRSNSGVEELLDSGVGGRVDHVREEMLLVLRIAVLCTAKSPKDRPTMRDVVIMLGEAKPRRKSSSATVAATVVNKDRPVFTTSPDSSYL